MKSNVLPVVCVLLVVGCAGRGGSQVRTSTAMCSLDTTTVEWMQRMLDGWVLVTRDFLARDPDPLPWMVLFDASCTWHLAAEADHIPAATPVATSLHLADRPVSVHGVAHAGTVHLPNGGAISADVMAAAFPYGNGEKAFFALALPDLWKRHPQASQDPHLDIRILSVALHEMIHARQMPILQQHIHVLGTQYDLPVQLTEDVIENRFSDIPSYREQFETERDLFYSAVAETMPARRDSLIMQALSVVQQRQKQFFADADVPYATLEGLFLNMEGMAEWIRFKFHQVDAAWPNDDAEIISFLRGRDADWIQDEGLALFLLLDEKVSGWQEPVLGSQMASPLELLRTTVAEPTDQ